MDPKKPETEHSIVPAVAWTSIACVLIALGGVGLVGVVRTITALGGGGMAAVAGATAIHLVGLPTALIGSSLVWVAARARSTPLIIRAIAVLIGALDLLAVGWALSYVGWGLGYLG